jgi:hypothetical protein
MRMRTLASLLSLLTLTASACSAVVAPDPGRLGLGHDGGPGHDGGTASLDVGAALDVGPTDLDVGASLPDAASPTGGLTDPSACGPSRVRCADARLCIADRCVCRPPLTDVGGACVDLATDPQNCGMPGNVCRGVCAMGVCAGACPDGTRECDGACVNLRRDPLNCGECGRACRANEACQDGSCRDIEIATGCTSCPCTSCRGLLCCMVPRFEVPYCLEADRCP